MTSVPEKLRIVFQKKKRRGLGHSKAKFNQDPLAGVNESVLEAAEKHRARLKAANDIGPGADRSTSDVEHN